jgi:penicillin-binding protein 1C
MQHQSWFILPPTVEYYYKQKHADYKPLPAFMNGCQVMNDKTMDIIYPEENARIYVPIEVTGEKGKTVFTATHRNNESKLFWHLDNDFVGTTQTFHRLPFCPAPGKHILTIVDEDGETVTRHFEILEKEKN